ncbi:MAG: hypothetical protein Q7J04_05930 [Microcella sp.]|nr:hypothetical protein [Microcella sp.]
MLHTGIPSEAELRALASTRSLHCISIYLPTSTLAAEAEQSRSLVIFATPERVLTYRIPNRVTATGQVSDRFHLKPLLRSVAFPQAAFVLALSQNAVRLVEVTIEGSVEEVPVADMPADASRIFATRGDKGSARLIGTEGEKTLLGHYSRQIDDAIRPMLNGLHVPLIIAGTEPLASIFRGVCRYDGLAAETIRGNAETMSAGGLAAEARPILDRLYADEVAALTARVSNAIGMGTGSSDLSDLARGATCGVVDEIARRALLTGARVVAVRADEIPDGAAAAAAAGIMRFAV